MNDGLPSCRSSFINLKTPFLKIKKLLLIVAIPVLIGIFLYLFKAPVLWAIGNFLICEDKVEQVEVIFVLGGGSFDRGNEAARLFKAGFTKQIVCLGENTPSAFKALNLSYSESRVTKINLMKNNKIPSGRIELMEKGTSTKEEADYVIQYCLENNVKKAIVLSSKFHTRRVKSVYTPLFEAYNIDLIIRGAPSSNYSEDEWWKTEGGLIMVNNEYVKSVYYFLKY